MVDLSFERIEWSKGSRFIAGIDEAGRGPLAGPVVAAAIVMPPEFFIEGVDDSKKILPQRREELAKLIQEKSVAIGIGIMDHLVIDEINILGATMKAMEQAVANLCIPPDHLLVDGPHFYDRSIPFTTIIDGDAKCFSIAAASIIAKVTRDRLMVEYDKKYPHYGFARHKGYGTRQHLDALRKYGPCEIHRRSFNMPEVIEQGEHC
jgi:ribonuclease HII